MQIVGYGSVGVGGYILVEIFKARRLKGRIEGNHISVAVDSDKRNRRDDIKAINEVLSDVNKKYNTNAVLQNAPSRQRTPKNVKRDRKRAKIIKEVNRKNKDK